MKLYGLLDCIGNRIVSTFHAKNNIIALRMNAYDTSDPKMSLRYRGFSLICLGECDERGSIAEIKNEVVCRLPDWEATLNTELEKEGL